MTITYRRRPISARYDSFKPSSFDMILLAILEMSKRRPLPKAVTVRPNLNEVIIRYGGTHCDILRGDAINNDYRCKALGLYYL